MSQIKIRNLAGYLPFILYYIGVGFFAYPLIVILTLLAQKIRLNKQDLLIIFLGVIYSLIKLTFDISIYNWALIGMYSFGFLVYYVFFKSFNETTRFNIRKLLFCLSLITIVEAFLVNTFVSVAVLPNYPDPNQANVYTAFFGFYQRPYGFCGQPSVTSSVLVAMMALQEDRLEANTWIHKLAEVLPIASVLLCASGTGYLALTVFFVLNKVRKAYIFVIIPVLLFIYFAVLGFLEDLVISTPLAKVSPAYILFLWNFKLEQIFETYNLTNYDMFQVFFGKTFAKGEAIPIGSDFGWINSLYVSGILGLAIIIIFIVMHVNKRNYQAIIVLSITSFHYATIFNIVGQAVFAYALTIKNRNQRNRYRSDCKRIVRSHSW